MNAVLHIPASLLRRFFGRKARVNSCVQNILSPHVSMTGRELRAHMRGNEVRYITLAGFYSDMVRLEDSGVLKGWYETVDISGTTVRQRWYRLV